jgi:hypothetical protein
VREPRSGNKKQLVSEATIGCFFTKRLSLHHLDSVFGEALDWAKARSQPFTNLLTPN